MLGKRDLKASLVIGVAVAVLMAVSMHYSHSIVGYLLLPGFIPAVVFAISSDAKTPILFTALIEWAGNVVAYWMLWRIFIFAARKLRPSSGDATPAS
jgi:hypothetical protein